MEGAGKVVTPATQEEYFGAVDSREVKERRESGGTGNAEGPVESRVGLDEDGEEECVLVGCAEAEQLLDESDAKVFVSVEALLN